MTLFRIHNNQHECGKDHREFFGMLSVPHNIVMDPNNPAWSPWELEGVDTS